MSVESSVAMGQPSQPPSFRLKGGLFPLTLIELTNGDLQRLRDDLKIKVAEAPSFFQQAPTVLSLELLEADSPTPDLHAIQQLCIEFGLIVVALRGASKSLQATAKELNLAILANSRTKSERDELSTEATSETGTDERSAQAEPVDAPLANDLFSASHAPILDDVVTIHSPMDSAMDSTAPDSAASNALNAAAASTKVITTPVRSGQQIYAAGGDLVVLAAVSAGAELLADGNIHVYGALRGRALAGVKGNTEARIFCQSLEAELISIAGYFKLNEDLRETQWKQSVQAYLTDETLNIEPLHARGR
jgi:septum site-determining protein MinC